MFWFCCLVISHPPKINLPKSECGWICNEGIHVYLGFVGLVWFGFLMGSLILLNISGSKGTPFTMTTRHCWGFRPARHRDGPWWLLAKAKSLTSGLTSGQMEGWTQNDNLGCRAEDRMRDGDGCHEKAFRRWWCWNWLDRGEEAKQKWAWERCSKQVGVGSQSHRSMMSNTVCGESGVLLCGRKMTMLVSWRTSRTTIWSVK